MKRCSSCRETKPLDAFNRSKAKADGRDGRCRDCAKAWYAANREEHKHNVWLRNRRRRKENREWMAAYLRDHPCDDCGEDDIRVLEFDHRPEERKLHEIAKLLQEPASIAKLLREIAKCDVVCANCHRRRTSSRANFWKEVFHLEAVVSAKWRARDRLAVLFPEIEPEAPGP